MDTNQDNADTIVDTNEQTEGSYELASDLTVQDQVLTASDEGTGEDENTEVEDSLEGDNSENEDDFEASNEADEQTLIEQNEASEEAFEESNTALEE